MAIDVELDILGPCNYSCKYCIGDGPANRYPEPYLHDLDRLTTLYKNMAQPSTVLRARGTEPALHPQMKDITRIVARAGPFLISTNLSLPVGSWLPGPENLTLLVTIHPEAEADAKRFLVRVRETVKLGYKVRVQMLGDGDRPEWREKLEKAGVTEPFKVLKIRSNARWRAQSAELQAAPPGSLCRAGYSLCLISYKSPGYPVSGTTQLYRCTVRLDPMAALLDKPEPCLGPKADTRCAAWVEA